MHLPSLNATGYEQHSAGSIFHSIPLQIMGIMRTTDPEDTYHEHEIKTWNNLDTDRTDGRNGVIDETPPLKYICNGPIRFHWDPMV